MNINVVGLRRLQRLAEQAERELWVTVDGRFTNHAVLKNLPELAKLIGRIRKDARLYGVAQEKKATAKGGRPRRYGPPLPTPEQMRKDKSLPWRKVKAYAAGKTHEFRVKTVEGVKWRPAGVGQVLRLIIIAPLEYRLSRKGKVLYREPAFLICTDGQLPLEKVLQAFLWRWGIELNFRDEKSVLGVGTRRCGIRTRCRWRRPWRWWRMPCYCWPASRPTEGTGFLRMCPCRRGCGNARPNRHRWPG